MTMPLSNFISGLKKELDDLRTAGTVKGNELVITEVIPPQGDRGPRLKLAGFGDKEFVRMNANSYLGMSLRKPVIEAEEHAARKYGVGPGAVRFISGTFEPHVELEKRLAAFHGREACMLTSAAYTSIMGVISCLTTPETMIISDELNHNCIINAMKLARPKGKLIYRHVDLKDLEAKLQEAVGQAEHAIVVTDGIFSMRGVYAPLKEIQVLVEKYNDKFPKDIVLLVDDSHGVGAMGVTGRGTEEYCGGKPVDILVATLGKALGVNGGYIVSKQEIIQYLREKNQFYIYTNPITPSEASAAMAALALLDSAEGKALLKHLAAMTKKFEQGLVDLGYETLQSPHPVTPLMVRDTAKTTELVKFLRENGVLATGLNYPVVPHGDQSIRFQIAADHTAHDIDYVLGVLKAYRNE
jgi:glycine C-acetyltransferase